MITPRGAWQHELVREWREQNDLDKSSQISREELIAQINSYDDQLTGNVGEGSHPEGRDHLRRLIKAGNAMLAQVTHD